jgi:hypothetical protein
LSCRQFTTPPPLARVPALAVELKAAIGTRAAL